MTRPGVARGVCSLLDWADYPPGRLGYRQVALGRLPCTMPARGPRTTPGLCLLYTSPSPRD
eukprot:12791575-Alexandrium_andersonii.AAC.1